MTTAYKMFSENESHSHTQISRFWIWFSTTVTTKTKKLGNQGCFVQLRLPIMHCSMKHFCIHCHHFCESYAKYWCLCV